MIGAGHSFTEIRGYTLKQFNAFIVATERQRRWKLADELVNLRMADAQKAPFNKYLKILKG